VVSLTIVEADENILVFDIVPIALEFDFVFVLEAQGIAEPSSERF
jgi:hypothetical protein